MRAKKTATIYQTAMLIDDNEIDNLINCKILEGGGFAQRIYIYTSGKSALEFLRNLENDKNLDHGLIPDIIFLDINMPLLDGFQFLGEFENLHEKISGKSKIVMLTTSINPSDRVRSYKYESVLAFTIKPLTPAYLKKIQ